MIGRGRILLLVPCIACISPLNTQAPLEDATQSIVMSVERGSCGTAEVIALDRERLDETLGVSGCELELMMLQYEESLAELCLEPGPLFVRTSMNAQGLSAPARAHRGHSEGGEFVWSAAEAGDAELITKQLFVEGVDFDVCAEAKQCLSNKNRCACTEACSFDAPNPPVAPTAISACPAMWHRATVQGVELCRPFNGVDPPVCEDGRVWRPGGCIEVGSTCAAAGEWPGVVDGVHVQDGATNGNGSRTRPYGTLAEAIADNPSGTTFVLASGEHELPPAVSLVDVAFVGACAMGTTPTTIRFGTTARFAGVRFENVRLDSSATTEISSSSVVELSRVHLESTNRIVWRAVLTVEQSLVEAALHVTQSAVVEDSLVRGTITFADRVTVNRSTFDSDTIALVAEGGVLALTDVAAVADRLLEGPLRSVDMQNLWFKGRRGIDQIIVEEHADLENATFEVTESAIRIEGAREDPESCSASASVDLNDTVVVQEPLGSAAGHAVAVTCARFSVYRVVVRSPAATGLALFEGSVDGNDIDIAGSVIGIRVRDAVTALLRRVRVRDTADEAILFDDVGTIDVKDGDFADASHFGVRVRDQNDLQMLRVRIHNVHGSGILVSSSGDVELVDLEVTNVGALSGEDLSECSSLAGTRCHGSGVHIEGRFPEIFPAVSLERFLLADNRDAGLTLSGGEIDTLTDGAILQNAVGVQLFFSRFRAAQLLENVRYENNVNNRIVRE